MCNILKMLSQKVNTIKYQNNLLRSLTAGDLVWSKMPFSKKELSSIEKSHQIRPYLIVHKDKFNIYAYPSSSKQSNQLNNCEEYFINGLRYGRNKNSFINLTKLYKIPFYNLKEKYVTLNEFDLRNIQKRLKIKENRTKNCTYLLPTNIYIIEGDVISIDHQLYYVYSSDNLYLYCFTIFKKCPKDKKNYKNIIINNKTYYTIFKDKKTFKRGSNFIIVNIAYQSEIKNILETKSGIQYKEKHLSCIEKKAIEQTHESSYENGTVFQVGKNKIVYLFKYKAVHYGVDLLMYKIRPKLIPIFDIEKRSISEILGTTDFIKIVEFLSLNNAHPLYEINALYEELREAVYH